MTYRERRLAKAERLRDWAASRERKAIAANHRFHSIADNIPLGQPILVGHHSERHARKDQERIYSACSAMVEHSDKAKDFRSRADGIEAAADRAIYSDDPEAIEALEARAAELDAKADKQVRLNKAAKKANPALRQWELPCFPSNTRANARRLRERIKVIRAEQARAALTLVDGA